MPFAQSVLVNHEQKYIKIEVKMAQESVNSPNYQPYEPIDTGFPAPMIAGNTGSSELDLMLSASEQALARARKQALGLRPLIEQGEANGDFLRQGLSLASGEQRNANSFLASAAQALESRQSRARKTLEANNPSPHVEAALIVQRCHSLEILFDSLKSKDIMQRIDLEMKNADETTRYILRGGERWIGAYLESRQLKELDLIFYIRQNAGILETDLVKACDELLTLPPQFAKLEDTKNAIEGAFFDLAMQIAGWQAKRQPFQANSALDGMPDNHVLTAGEFRSAIRELARSGKPGFFNKNL